MLVNQPEIQRNRTLGRFCVLQASPCLRRPVSEQQVARLYRSSLLCWSQLTSDTCSTAQALPYCAGHTWYQAAQASTMIRRNARLRKEYLYRKSLEGKEKASYERKRLIRQALEAGKPIPTELRSEEGALRKEIALEDDNTAVPRTHIDDEYARAGERDPKVLVTTSRDPSSRLTQFAKEVKLVIPNAQRVNRGGMVLSELVETCRNHDFTDVVVLHEHRGEPDGMVVCHLPYGPTAYFGIFNTVLRHDIGQKKEVGTISEAYPHIILDRLNAPLGARIGAILKHLFPPPKDDSKRVVTFANRDDYISFRHHTYTQPRGPASTELKECGPRFELKPYQIKLGTMDQAHAENEWVLRAYTRSAKKAKLAQEETPAE